MVVWRRGFRGSATRVCTVHELPGVLARHPVYVYANIMHVCMCMDIYMYVCTYQLRGALAPPL